MNLILDVGNTFTKLAVFQEDKILKKQSFLAVETSEIILQIFKKYPNIRKTILASVTKVPESILQLLRKKTDLLFLDASTKVPFLNNYKTPGSLGIDRIALATAAVQHYAKKNVLIIDAGTCVTYDFVDNTGAFQGGAISPGLKMRYLAMHNFTAKLPLLDANAYKVDNFTGKTTLENIHLGAADGLIFEIDGFINRYKTEFPDLTVIFTGGDANFLSKKVKNSIFVAQNFLLEGLNLILEYNKI